MRTTTLLLVLVSFLPGKTPGEELFKGYKATMVVYDQNEQNYIIMNEARAPERFTPFSTHKVPHSIIALESGRVGSIDEPLSWDSIKFPEEDWWPMTWKGEHTLRSAIQVSLVPAYRQIASDLGAKAMSGYMEKFDYGNADISSGVDSYWLNGSLQISAMEQVNFLRRFHTGTLDVSPEVTAAVKTILVRDSEEAYTFSHKTGTGTIDQETRTAIAWLVGYVERDGNVYFFAFNMEAPNFNEAVNVRMQIATNVLTHLGIL